MEHPLSKELEDLKILQCNRLSENIKLTLSKKSQNQYHIHHEKPSSEPGVYMFWWTGNKKLLNKKTVFKPTLRFKNSKGKFITMNVHDYWSLMNIDITGDDLIPLYIGKAGDIFKRYCRHLMISKPRLLPIYWNPQY